MKDNKITFGCWCKPEKCHGDVIIKILKQMRDNQNKN